VIRPSIEAPGTDLALTLECGQVFHWRRDGAGWRGLVGEKPARLEQRGTRLHFDGADAETVARYLALDHPLDAIYATFPRDPAMDAALAFCRGLRIVRQPAWECLATFITSAMKQVAHIRQMSEALRRRFGTRVTLGGSEFFTYPTPAAIAALDERDLRECKLGFRAKNLLAAARSVASGEVGLDKIAALPDDAARAELMRLRGVGEKVANCVLLFAYGRLAAFPIDVWIGRVLREIYFPRKRKVTPHLLREFSAGHFGEYGGYAQQYLFHHARMTWKKGAAAEKRLNKT
jgi:N-glycosylase/DNA lyase